MQPCNIYQKDLAQCCTYSAPACKATLHAAVWALLGHEPLVFLPYPANSRQAATVHPASSLECACLCASVAKHSAATAARQLSVVLFFICPLTDCHCSSGRTAQAECFSSPFCAWQAWLVHHLHRRVQQAALRSRASRWPMAWMWQLLSLPGVQAMCRPR